MGFRQRQRVIDILVNIVLPRTPTEDQVQDNLTDGQVSHVLIFVINEIIHDTAVLEPTVLNKLVDALCNIPKKEKISRDLITEKENAIIRLLSAEKLINISDTALLNFAQRANL